MNMKLYKRFQLYLAIGYYVTEKKIIVHPIY